MADGSYGLALGAGLIAAVNPCGFALLPAYLSLLVVGDDQPGRARAVGRALLLTAAMSAGFAGVFAVFGLAIAPAASGIQRHLPWFTLGLGLLLVLVGGLMAAGRSVGLPHLPARWVPARWRRRGPRPLNRSFWSMAGFGAAYATASLTCTVAPFLAVVVAGFRGDSTWTGIGLLLTYAAGMSLVVGTAAVAVALARNGIVRGLRRSAAWLPRATGAVLALAGAYVAYYGWWELRVLDGADPDDPVISTAASVQRWLADLVDSIGPRGWIAAALAVIAAGALLWRRPRSAGPVEPAQPKSEITK